MQEMTVSQLYHRLHAQNFCSVRVPRERIRLINAVMDGGLVSWAEWDYLNCMSFDPLLLVDAHTPYLLEYLYAMTDVEYRFEAAERDIEASRWILEKLRTYKRAFAMTERLSRYMKWGMEAIVSRREDFLGVSLIEALFQVITEGIYQDLVSITSYIENNHSCRYSKHMAMRLVEDMSQIFSSYDLPGWSEYERKVRVEITRHDALLLRYHEMKLADAAGKLTVARLSRFLLTTDFYEFEYLRQLRIISDCIANPDDETYWHKCVFHPELVYDVDHCYVEELSLVIAGTWGSWRRSAIKWLDGKLRDYVPIVFSKGLCSDIFPLRRRDMVRYNHVSLNDAIIDMIVRNAHTLITVGRSTWSKHKLRQKIAKVAILRKFVDFFKEFPQGGSSGPGQSDAFRIAGGYIARIETEIQKDEQRPWFTSAVRDCIDLVYEASGDISISSGRQLFSHTLYKSNDWDIWYDIDNNCRTVFINKTRYLVPTSSMNALLALTRCFGYYRLELPWREKELYIPYSAESDLLGLLKSEAESEESCIICMENRNGCGCGNCCSATMCWSCFHNWFSKNSKCPACRRGYIPLTYRK